MPLPELNKLPLPVRLSQRAVRAVYGLALREQRGRVYRSLLLAMGDVVILLFIAFNDTLVAKLQFAWDPLPLFVSVLLAGALLFEGLRLSLSLRHLRELREEMQAQLENARRSA